MISRPSTSISATLLAVTAVCFVITTAAGDANRDWSAYPMSAGPFEGSWESLQKYRCPEWFRDTKLDFDRLVKLYGEAGAKYVVPLAVLHDNFDLWNSRHHAWNSVKKGPKRDLVGEFRTAALKHKLRFGVTTHLARSYSWFQTNKDGDYTVSIKPRDPTNWTPMGLLEVRLERE